MNEQIIILPQKKNQQADACTRLQHLSYFTCSTNSKISSVVSRRMYLSLGTSQPMISHILNNIWCQKAELCSRTDLLHHVLISFIDISERVRNNRMCLGFTTSLQPSFFQGDAGSLWTLKTRKSYTSQTCKKLTLTRTAEVMGASISI